MADYITNTTDLTKVANAIREKGGTTEPLAYPDEFVTAIGDISGGGGGTITQDQEGYIVISEDGSTPALQSKTVTPSETAQTVTADTGYNGLSSVKVNAISSTYVGSGITKKSAATITPGTTNKTIASGTYLTGTQTIAGDADLVASNIKQGVNIFGVTGTYSGGGGELYGVTVQINHTGLKYDCLYDVCYMELFNGEAVPNIQSLSFEGAIEIECVERTPLLIVPADSSYVATSFSVNVDEGDIDSINNTDTYAFMLVGSETSVIEVYD